MDVEMLTYHAGGFFADRLVRAGIPCRVAGGRGGLSRVASVRSCFISARPEAVLAFLPMPAMYAELASLVSRRWGLVVGERSSSPDAAARGVRLRRQLHRLADATVTNSHANRLMMEATVSGLRGRVSTIYNSVDFEEFAPRPMPPHEGEALRVVVAASYRRLKNVCGWIEAVHRATSLTPAARFTTDWFGGAASAARGSDERRRAEDLVSRYGLEGSVRLHDAVSDIAERYAQAHVVALPSFYEGLPNAICEAMACARPAAASAVSDAGNLVREGVTGVLLDPKNPDQIAEKLVLLSRTSNAELTAMGRAGLARARELLDIADVGRQYRILIEAAARRSRPEPVFWPGEVPSTARVTAEAACAR